MSEVWLPIPGYEGCYEVSNMGRIASLNYRRSGKRGIRAQSITRSGHKIVTLVRGDTHYVHLLVLLAFVGPRPEGQETRHLDGDASNNRLCNLAYGTRKQNMEDRRAHGVLSVGERHGNSKLTASQVLDIRRRCEDGETQASVANSLGLPRPTIASVVQRVSWKHI